MSLTGNDNDRYLTASQSDEDGDNISAAADRSLDGLPSDYLDASGGDERHSGAARSGSIMMEDFHYSEFFSPEALAGPAEVRSWGEDDDGGGDGGESEIDPCFARIVEGEDVMMRAWSGKHRGEDSNILRDPVTIVKASILDL